MRPVLFQWRGVTFWAYPTLLYLGLVAGVLCGNLAARAAGLDPLRVYVATFLLLLPALAGARLLYVACNLARYRGRISAVWSRQDGGAAQYGGLILAVPLSFPILRSLDLPIAAFWDVGLVTILVGMIPTRVGCFLNGCCAGRPSSAWCSLVLPNTRGEWTRRIPTQWFEALFAAAILVSGILLWDRMPFPGAFALYAVACYGAGRLILESLRELPPGKQFTVEHAISAALLVLSLTAFTLAR